MWSASIQRPQRSIKAAADMFAIILDYRGGNRTDALVETLADWNKAHRINVLDNASGYNLCRYVTHRNRSNSYTGGGIRDCIQLCAEAGARYLLFVANDVECITPMRFAKFMAVAKNDERVVQVSAAITPDTAQADCFPWMVCRPYSNARIVPHADILLSLLDTFFIADFGGFPPSRGGWGYGWELAYHAQLRSKQIIVLDDCVVRHYGLPQDGDPHDVRAHKADEAIRVYNAKYGGTPWAKYRESLAHGKWRYVQSPWRAGTPSNK